MTRQYRVWTKDDGKQHIIRTDWQTYARCKQWIIQKWGFVPSFVFISSAKNRESFIAYNGI